MTTEPPHDEDAPTEMASVAEATDLTDEPATDSAEEEVLGSAESASLGEGEVADLAEGGAADLAEGEVSGSAEAAPDHGEGEVFGSAGAGAADQGEAVDSGDRGVVGLVGGVVADLAEGEVSGSAEAAPDHGEAAGSDDVHEAVDHASSSPESGLAETATEGSVDVTADAVIAPQTDEEPADDDGLPPLSDGELESALEALLLVVDAPVEEEALADAVDVTPLRVAERLRLLADRYADQDRGIDLRRAGGGWRFYTRDRYAPYVEKLLLDGQRAKLTRAALETLAVIAYRQPVTRARVAAVRGVNCDGVIRTLLARGLVEETGTDTETGGFLYRTTELFLERLGLSSLEELPPIAPLLPEVDSIDEL